MNNMKTQAVITGDIINFTHLTAGKRQQLIMATEALLKTWTAEKENAEIFRGDSYQILFNDVSEALIKSIQLICWFKQHSEKKNNADLGTRISVGIGAISYQGKNVLNSDGEAFHLSGRNFDKMKDEEYLSIHTAEEEKNAGIKVILSFINKYIEKWTKAQAEVIFMHLEGKNQQETAKILSVSQPSVNSRLKSAGWKEIESAIKYITYLVQEK